MYLDELSIGMNCPETNSPRGRILRGIPGDELSGDELSGDELSGDELSRDKLSSNTMMDDRQRVVIIVHPGELINGNEENGLSLTFMLPNLPSLLRH
jgi:hypothetical protein